VTRSWGDYFFKLQQYQNGLVKFRPTSTSSFRATARTAGRRILKEPLTICASRARKRPEWGIPLPFDQGYVTYVWFERSSTTTRRSWTGRRSGARRTTSWQGHLVPPARRLLADHAARGGRIPLHQGLSIAHGWWLQQRGAQDVERSTGNALKPARPRHRSSGVDAFRYSLIPRA